MTGSRRLCAATIPHRVDVDGSLCRAGAGIKRGGSWAVYWMLDGGRRREWLDVAVDGMVDALRLARELNARDRLA